jgi:hypothetical protein
MVGRLGLLGLFLLVPHTVAAGTIVTWQANGVIGSSSIEPNPRGHIVPPPGTPYELTLMFDPSSMTPTVFGPPGSNCYTVSVSSSLTVGAFTYTGSGAGFTHGKLPGTACSPGWPETQFLLGFGNNPTDSPYPIPFGFMELWYRDLLVQDAFPDAPTHLGGGFQIRDEAHSFLITAKHNLHGVEEMSAVPEPGTMMLFGLGLAAVARRVRHLSSSKQR